jgi:cytidine deaminase
MSQSKTSVALTPAQIDDLHHRATAAAHNAYAPYSHFRVGAAILLEDGNIVTGCNVENASYRLTCCAEQTAIATAVAQHGPAIRIRAVVVANLNATASQPCGACRQTIYEFSTPTTEVFYPAEDHTLTRSTASELLPSGFRFTTDNL